MRRRLYLQIYVGFVAIAATFTIAGLLWHWTVRRDADAVPTFFVGVVELVGSRLPAPGSSPDSLERVLREQAETLGALATLWDAQDRQIASTGAPIGPLRHPERSAEWVHRRGGPPGLAVRLKDGRRLALALEPQAHEHGSLALAFVFLAAVVAAGAYPLSRRITGRLERLRSAVDRLGAGELASRVPVEGRDEVAELATSFNRAADRIETLVDAQKRVLASASHELRSPLARLRVAVEMMTEGDRSLQSEASADIAELDALIEDVLLGARLEAGAGPVADEDIDLLAVVVEEGARVDAEVNGEPASVRGNAHALSRLARNLFDNARRHAPDRPISATIVAGPEGEVRFSVADRGPGIPEEDRERVFEPFYRRAGHSEERDGGVGLGLSLVREIARHHGGSVRALPRQGGGTVVEVTLPLA